MIDVADNLAGVRERVARAEERAGRPLGSVKIIAVSKTKPAALVSEAIRAGVTTVGENYVQEAAGKIDAVGRTNASWHLIGHLQRNKVTRAVELFDVIQTIDSLALVDALDRQGVKRAKPVRILIEVNTGGEASKSGVAPERAAELVAQLSARTHLRVEGLMTVPPPVSAAADVRPYFVMLRRLREQLAPSVPTISELSMGMSEDFEVAIEEGATMVRIGRAIFGVREG
ncbi:MAG: YggS family pyridoxal phosphate-dependent enzyme [Deltaproteobacteria bacterium]|nr:YggS family pyridoxal phosphate-dependent enzyme [Deltaproteobacteria bacterium]MBI3388862.1 YggS family pyridoxal phosphate-dependent enzyme [Deltaproteobacteria bacterium]